MSTQPELPILKILMRGPRDQRGNKRDVILRRAMSTDGVTITNSKTEQGVFNVKWKAYYVSNTVRPYAINDRASSVTPGA